MKPIISKQRSVVSVVMLAGMLLASAQQYAVPWHRIAGGGGMRSTGGAYTLSGTIGQPDAGAQMAGGNHSLTGGFWAVYAVPARSAPVLSISLTDNKMVMLSWPSPSTGDNLEVTSNVAASSWVPSPASVIDNGTIKYILIDRPTGRLFFRLKKP